jgi:hypothetical protein
MPRFLCIFAMPRTGSSRLVQLLTHYPKLNVKGELFHSIWVGRLSKYDRAALAAASDGVATDDTGLRAWRCRHPGKTLETLYESGGGNTVVFKVFPFHVAKEDIAAEIIDRADAAYAILKRRPIESYISSLKAKETGAYERMDTTRMQPVLQPPDFVRWATRMMDWYQWCEVSLKAAGKPVLRMNYENDLSGSDETVIGKSSEILATAGIDAGSPSRPKQAQARQDRESRYQDRVANWAEFEAAIRSEPNGATLLDWAETAP